MEVTKTELEGVLIIEPDVYEDERGFFCEGWHKERYRQVGIEREFVQDNVSFSKKGTLRGLHYQCPNEQGKLVWVLDGEVFDVVADIRVGSPTFGKWVGVMLSSENKKQFYIPPGFAHGFCVISDTALFSYKCTDVYNPAAAGFIRYDDPAIGIEWPGIEKVLSEKDRNAALLSEIETAMLPKWNG